jgi:hypothetical protein
VARAWLKPKEPVIVLRLGKDVRAYPLQILMYHEIVNEGRFQRVSPAEGLALLSRVAGDAVAERRKLRTPCDQFLVENRRRGRRGRLDYGVRRARSEQDQRGAQHKSRRNTEVIPSDGCGRAPLRLRGGSEGFTKQT